MELLREVLRQRVSYLRVLQTEIRTALKEASGVLGVRRAAQRIGDSTLSVLQLHPVDTRVQQRVAYYIRIAYPYLICHVRSQCMARAVALKRLALRVVNLIARYALEEQLDVHAIEVCTEVDTVGYFWERVA